MQPTSKRLGVWAAITAAVLLIALYGNSYIDGWNWRPFDFVFATALIFGSGLAYELISRRTSITAYRVAVGFALLGMFLLIWINGAVGIIGDSDVNMLYSGVVLTFILGAIFTRLKPQGMSLVLFVTAFAQFLIPVVAFLINTPDFTPGVIHVFILNGFFVMMFIFSGLFFRHATISTSKNP